MTSTHLSQSHVSDPVAASIVELIQQLVRTPSRAGVDEYAPIFAVLQEWLRGRGIDVRIHDGSGGGPIALVAEVAGTAGPQYVLNATVDTAGFGDTGAWTLSPTGGEIHGGWLHGRGAADSKAGTAIFCHVAQALLAQRDAVRGTLKLIFDADEHTGEFGGIRRAIEREGKAAIAGVMLGYPGFEHIGVGGRGFERAVVTVHGESAHSGSSRKRGIDAIAAAARLVERLGSIELPPADSDVFPLPPRVTVTRIEGGHGFSEVADLCHLNVDVRLTPWFGREQARALLVAAAETVRGSVPGMREIEFDWQGGWPAYRLSSTSVVARALGEAAREVLPHEVVPVVVGPSNVGNFLFQQGVEATCGFGVAYRNVHAANECIDLATVRPVYEVYLRAVRNLLATG